MTFQTPMFLWALFLLVIPLLIHFFDFSKVRTIRFSNVRFLNSLERQNSPRKKIKERLLLLSRIFMLVFVILSFSNPSVRYDAFSLFDQELIVVDNSQSLRGDCESSDCLQQSKDILLGLAKGELKLGKISAEGWYSPKAFYGERELSSILAALEFQKSGFVITSERTQMILSDFQSEIVNSIQGSLVDSIRFTLIPVSRSGLNNIRIDSAFLSNRNNTGDGKKSVGLVISNDGEKAINGALLRLTGMDRQLGSIAISLAGGESQIVDFEIDEAGISEFVAVVEDYQTPFDNEFYFFLPEVSAITVSVVSNSDSKNLRAVFGNKKLFDLSMFNERTLDFEKIFTSDLLILNSFERLPDWVDLERVKGSILIIPANEIDIANYSNELGLFVRKSNDTSSFDLASSSIKHPFFNDIFNDLKQGVELPKVSNLYTIRGGDPLLHGDRNYLTYFSNQKLYWFSSPLESPFTNIGNHSIFLPIMYRLAESTRSFNEPLSYELTHAPIELSIESNGEAVPVLVNESGRYIPELNYRGSSVIFTLPPDLNDPGIYHLVSDQDTLRTIALNYPISESRMDFMGYEELKEHFRNEPGVRVLDASSLDKLQMSLDELSGGSTLWKYALILALMFLLGETAIHKWMK